MQKTGLSGFTFKPQFCTDNMIESFFTFYLVLSTQIEDLETIKSYQGVGNLKN